MMRLLDSVRRQMRVTGYADGTVARYTGWMRRYIFYHGLKHPADLGPSAVVQFVRHLTIEQQMSAATHNQALDALRYLYNDVLGVPVDDALQHARARTSGRCLPEIAPPEAVNRMLKNLPPRDELMAELMFGSGLRVGECVKLRVAQVDIDRREIRLAGRCTVLPASIAGRLGAQVALAGHWPGNVSGYVFPSRRMHGGQCWHVSASSPQKSLRRASLDLGLVTVITPKILRYTFAAELLKSGYDVRTVQELMGQRLDDILAIKQMMDVQRVISPLDDNTRKKSVYW